ncbi:hypothetical protein MSAN_01615200 [Mycena sanguinolenta]|uniref:DUF6534 domain-containing protein n=1 Tax=Mycena sanguinolenta TaxID=230812 RepID=A0A8H6Y2H7_9AGAR|nr:hypothetical protein MSAN_01615200 [Mycena sanguinolenta]
MSCPSFDVGETFGALLVGSVHDPSSMVGIIWCAELANGIGLVASLYRMVITNFGHPERLVFFPTSLLVSAVMGTLVSVIVPGFFTFRIYALSKSLWIPCLCWAILLFRLIPECVIVLGFGIHEPIHTFLERWGTMFNAIWGASAINDLLIAGTMVFLLYRHRSGAMDDTAAIVDKMIEWTIETGVLNSIISIAMLSVFIAMRDNFIWMAFFVVVSRIFSNSLLASLNSRAAFRSANHLTFVASVPNSFPRATNPVNITVEMTRTTYEEGTAKL